MAPVVSALKQRERDAEVIVVSTGQHREMLYQALRLFDIVPDIELGVMTQEQGLAGLTSRLIAELDSVVSKVNPHWIIAQGDTTSVLCSALTAFYRRIGFAHVEAGLRTHDKFEPFPEEINRAFADLVADRLYAPTARAYDELVRSGVDEDLIVLSGNTVVDALQTAVLLPYDWSSGPLACIPEGKRLVLVTAHRRESFGKKFEQICGAIRELGARWGGSGVEFVFPVHLNPNVRRPVMEMLSGAEGVSLIEPLDYLSLIKLLARSVLTVTDSGGIQEEGPSLGVPVVVIRDRTERPEGVEAGVARLVGTSMEKIVREVSLLLDDEALRHGMVTRNNPYGDGKAGVRIVADLLNGAPRFSE